MLGPVGPGSCAWARLAGVATVRRSHEGAMAEMLPRRSACCAGHSPCCSAAGSGGVIIWDSSAGTSVAGPRMPFTSKTRPWVPDGGMARGRGEVVRRRRLLDGRGANSTGGRPGRAGLLGPSKGATCRKQQQDHKLVIKSTALACRPPAAARAGSRAACRAACAPTCAG